MLFSFSVDKYWLFIGGRDLDKTHEFRWPNEENVDFNNWAPGEPNGYLLNDDCIAIIEDRDRPWMDVNCLFILPYVCTASAKEPITA